MFWLWVATGICGAGIPINMFLGHISKSKWGDWDIQYIFGWMFCAIAVVVLVTVAGVQTVNKRNCAYAGHKYQRNTKWDFWAGCYIAVNGHYVNLTQYQAFVNDSGK